MTYTPGDGLEATYRHNMERLAEMPETITERRARYERNLAPLTPWERYTTPAWIVRGCLIAGAAILAASIF
jgi:hypothetical protein